MRTAAKQLKNVALIVLIGLISAQLHAQTVTSTYYHTDALGSIVAASDEQGDIIWQKTYDPYGNEVISTENGDEFEGQAYTGKPYDEETGLVYLGQRYYDPEIKRFMGMDPVGFRPNDPTSFNKYAYANNNPYKYIDPDGRQATMADAMMFGRDISRRSAAGQTDGEIAKGLGIQSLTGLGLGVTAGGLIYGGAACSVSGACLLTLHSFGLGTFAASGDPIELVGSGVFKTGVNITALSSANKFRTIMSPSVGRTFVTEPKAIESLIGPLVGSKISISSLKARQLEKALGLNPNSLESKNIISIIDDIPSRLPASPMSGNSFFLGGGQGLPGGGSELIIPAIPSAGGPGIRQILLEVN